MKVNERFESKNFEPLRLDWPELYQFASSAEAYVHVDTSILGFKLRCFIETMTCELYSAANLPRNAKDDFFSQLKNSIFTNLVEKEILRKFHLIRIVGNKAAHGKSIPKSEAMDVLEEAFLLTQWFCKLFDRGSEQRATFTIPPNFKDVNDELMAENQSLADALEHAKADLKRLQARLSTAPSIQNSIEETPDPSFVTKAKRAMDGLDLKSERTRQSLKLIDSFTEYRLTQNQIELVINLQRFLESETDHVFLLKGYAGTGKTFITKGLTEYLRSLGRGYVLAAPTGKAAKVIQEKTKSVASTIHSKIYALSKFVEYKDANLDGSETFKYYSEIALNEESVDSVYVFDEASMISDQYSEGEFFRFGSGYLLADLFKFVNLDNNDHNKKIIFIGDNAQLPPVGMSASPALQSAYLKENYGISPVEFELTEVVRQKDDSGVMANAIKLRKSIEQANFNDISINFDRPDIAPLEHADLLGEYLRSCSGKINGESIVVAPSNRDVANYNRSIRAHFFPNNETIVAGDKVMSVMNTTAEGFLISNGDFGLVRDVTSATERRTVQLRNRNRQTKQVETKEVELCFREIVVGFRQLGGVVNIRTKIIENLLYSQEPNLSPDETKALYIDFCIRHPHLKPGTQPFKDTLFLDPYFKALRLKFGYAITGHKAQGSEWNNVFIKCSKMGSQRNSDYFRWLYTALTRTKSKAWLMDAPHFSASSDLRVVWDPAELQAIAPNQRQENSSTPPPTELPMADLLLDFDRLNIPETAGFRLGILRRLYEALLGTGIKPIEVVECQYQEHYWLQKGQKGQKFGRVAIVYNGKAKITGIRALTQDELSIEAAQVLRCLVGRVVVTQSQTDSDSITQSIPDLGEDFLNEHHLAMRQQCEMHDIRLLEAKRMDWSLRYCFERAGENAVVDIYFNGKGRFTTVKPMTRSSTCRVLLQEVTGLVSENRDHDHE